MENLFLYEKGRAVPQNARKEITGGRLGGKEAINPMWRIKKLTELFGPCGVGWYYKSVREWLEYYDTSIAAFVKIELYIKVEEEWSKPIQGTGGSMFVEIQSKGPYISAECFKMATTDAISVACKQLGIGADVYWPENNSNEKSNNSNQKSNYQRRYEESSRMDEAQQRYEESWGQYV